MTWFLNRPETAINVLFSNPGFELVAGNELEGAGYRGIDLLRGYLFDEIVFRSSKAVTADNTVPSVLVAHSLELVLRFCLTPPYPLSLFIVSTNQLLHYY